jgi:RNA polymerase sigma-70 factor (ECF subfamily)
VSLLLRVQAQDRDAWDRLVFLYTPLVYDWCRGQGLKEADAADVGQDVFWKLARALTERQYERGKGTFRGWLRTVTRNAARDFLRREQKQPHGIGSLGDLEQVERVPPGGDEEDPTAAATEEQFLCRRALVLARAGTEEKSWSAFWRVTVEGQEPARVAADLGMTVNAVYIARFRVMARLKEEFADLIEFEGPDGAHPATPPRPAPDARWEASDGTR